MQMPTALDTDREIAYPAPTTVPHGERRVEFDYLRTFVIVLVVWHHAVLAYAAYSVLNPENPIETFSPVVDVQRWVGFDILTGLNDTYFMFLLYFISGLFVWRSLTRKGTGGFVRDRLKRLGIPFAVAVTLLIPLAYYPAQLTVERNYGGDTSYAEFWLGMVRNGFGTAGPLWFIWVLLVFDCLVALVYQLASPSSDWLQRRAIPLFERPLRFFGVLLVIALVAYLPLALTFAPFRWIGFGPFVAQANRILLYLVYFLAGVAVGAYGLDRSMLRSAGPLAKRWWAWMAAGVLSFVVLLVLLGAATSPASLSIVFVVTCAALVFGVMAFFLRFATRRIGMLDSLVASAYGIYLVHYVLVTWLQYALLGVELPAIAKGNLVFVVALLLSWGTIVLIRRIPAVARIL